MTSTFALILMSLLCGVLLVALVVVLMRKKVAPAAPVKVTTGQHTVAERIRSLGLTAHAIPGAQRTAIGITGNKGAVDLGQLQDEAEKQATEAAAEQYTKAAIQPSLPNPLSAHYDTATSTLTLPFVRLSNNTYFKNVSVVGYDMAMTPHQREVLVGVATTTGWRVVCSARPATPRPCRPRCDRWSRFPRARP